MVSIIEKFLLNISFIHQDQEIQNNFYQLLGLFKHFNSFA
jgi:hypothetical protein